MSSVPAPPNAERKKAENGVAKWIKYLLRNRQILLLVMKALFWVVKIARALQNLFGDP